MNINKSKNSHKNISKSCCSYPPLPKDQYVFYQADSDEDYSAY